MKEKVERFRSEVENEPIGVAVVYDVGYGYKIYVHGLFDRGAFLGYEVLRENTLINPIVEMFGYYVTTKYVIREFFGGYKEIKKYLADTYSIDFYIIDDKKIIKKEVNEDEI